ncbi:Hypothetical protein POVN_LOCUS91 [uncultured virus]|nr:Hypothetical protein POVN_LOCUS91 [uncultured virus]
MASLHEYKKHIDKLGALHAALNQDHYRRVTGQTRYHTDADLHQSSGSVLKGADQYLDGFFTPATHKGLQSPAGTRGNGSTLPPSSPKPVPLGYSHWALGGQNPALGGTATWSHGGPHSLTSGPTSPLKRIGNAQQLELGGGHVHYGGYAGYSGQYSQYSPTRRIGDQGPAESPMKKIGGYAGSAGNASYGGQRSPIKKIGGYNTPVSPPKVGTGSILPPRQNGSYGTRW